MRLTLVVTTIIFTALLTYAKLLAISDAQPRVYNAAATLRTNGCPPAPVSSPPRPDQSN